MRRPCRDGRKVGPAQDSSAGPRASELIQPAGFCVKACSLFILDKGKPVERPGRKAKGRSGFARRLPGCRRGE